jgi:hypothetical protein
MFRERAFPPQEVSRLDQMLADFPDHPILSRYRVQEVGRGGYRVVFSLEKHPGLVAKVDPRQLKKGVDVFSHQEDSPGQREEFVGHLKEQVTRDRRRLHHLRAYFGDWIPRERIVLRDLSVTEDLVHFLEHPHDEHREITHDASCIDVPAVVHLQERVSFENSCDIGFVLHENDSSCSDERYVRLHRVLSEPHLGADYLGSFFAGQELLRVIRDHARARDLLRTFITRVSTYTHEVGEMIDFAGRHNCFLYLKHGKSWDISLPDALTPREYEWSFANDSLTHLLSDGACTKREAQALMHALSYTRFLAACADAIDLRSIELPRLKDVDRIPLLDLRRMLLASINGV